VLSFKLYDVTYIHPGVYRIFNYATGIGKTKAKEVHFWAWSCCNITDKKNNGCRRTIITPYRFTHIGK
jgi:hypothetical protein